MPIPDIILLALLIAAVPVCVFRPWIGILVYSWIGYMSPHRLMSDLVYNAPVAKLVAIPTLIGLLWTTERRPIPRSREVYLLIALWVTFLLSTLFTAIYPDIAWDRFIEVTKMLLMTGVTLVLFQDQHKIRVLLYVIALSIGFYGIVGGIWAFSTGWQQGFYGPPDSAIYDNNALGSALTIVLPLFVFLRYQETRPWIRATLLIMAGACGLGVFATFSRGAFLGLCVVLALVLVKSRMKDIPLLALVLSLFVVAAVIPGRWHARIQSMAALHQDGSAQKRFKAMFVAYRLALDHPVLGAGFGPFTPETYRRYLPDYPFSHDAHNHFLQVLAEHGLLGFSLFSALVVSVLFSLRRTIRTTRNDPHRRWIFYYAHGIEVSVVAYIVAGLFLNQPYSELFYQLVAIAIILRVCAARASADGAAAATAVAGTEG